MFQERTRQVRIPRDGLVITSFAPVSVCGDHRAITVSYRNTIAAVV